MTRHWNEVPHRLGLFGVNEGVRPQYFVYQMLSRLGDERLSARATGELGVLAGRRPSGTAILLVNYSIDEPCDRAARILVENLDPGRKRLTVFRVDDGRRWDPQGLELLPVEEREVSTDGALEFHILLPAGSVALVCLDKQHSHRGRGPSVARVAP